MQLNQDVIIQTTGNGNFKKGLAYYRSGKVISANVNYHDVLEGKVRGTKIYTVKVANGLTSCQCTCPISLNCKHVAAVMLYAMEKKLFVAQPEKTAEEKLPFDVNAWISKLSDEPKKNPELYDLSLLINFYYSKTLRIEFEKQKLLKNGKLSTTRTKIKLSDVAIALAGNGFGNVEKEFLTSLFFNFQTNNKGDFLGLNTEFLSELLRRNLCVFSEEIYYSREYHALKLGENLPGTFEWHVDDKGVQSIKLMIPDHVQHVLTLDYLWYFNKKTYELGVIQTDVPAHQAKLLLESPKIRPEHADILIEELARKKIQVLAPQKIQKTTRKAKEIRPVLEFKPLDDTIMEYEYFDAGVFLSYEYDELIIPSYPKASTKLVKSKGELIDLARNLSFEKQIEGDLHRLGIKHKSTFFKLLDDDDFDEDLAENAFLVMEHNPESFWHEILTKHVPKFKEKGWIVKIDPDFPYQYEEEVSGFYTDLEENNENHWFDVELGVEISGQKLNLLPIISNILKYSNIDNIDNIKDDYELFIRSEQKKLMRFIWKDIKHIFKFINELYNTHQLSEDGKYQLSRYDTIYLENLEAAEKSLQHRWFDQSKLMDLSKKLRHFKGIESVKVPETFKAELRPYQQEGVNWLQFLRNHELGGILADDMGLGKTVQTLAYLAIEKAENRLTKPALVIAPTSLMVNWEAETQKFTPHFKTVMMHGNDRKERITEIAQADIVFTTYSLLGRDKLILLDQYFHVIILDEAHRIKNNKTITTQIAFQLKAENRICLSGTPLENHLGELWSIFHFLAPGMLGSETHFKKNYRTPIEKKQNEPVRAHLVRRIKPFLLRRTKDIVANELPPKTEIIQKCVLDRGQRDLYETIRVSMHKKVQQEIATKGLAKSHITILDALLKLRQACCDPRLLSLETAKKVEQSAKLEMLMEMIPELIEEGRKILLFSQFTSMLDLIKPELEKEKIPYVILTGSTLNRKTPIEKFQSGKVPLFLISLKAGGVGLNLTQADTVIHYDPWWNPAVENQATDRAHRIGQRKNVFVYKLIAQDSVEEKIIAMQENKKALANAILNPEGKESYKLTAEDVSALFEK